MDPLSPRSQRGIRAAIILPTLALCAYFLAQGTTGALAHRLFAALEGAPTSHRAGKPPNLTREEKTIAAIVSRNIFGPDVLLSERPPEASASGGEGGPSGEGQYDEDEDGFPDDGIIPRCEGNIRLVAAVVHPTNPMSSVAAIADSSGSTMLYREGMTFDNREIVAIAPHRIILRPSGGRYCQMPMFNTEIGPSSAARPQPAANRAASAPRVRTSTDRNAGLTNDEMAQGIQKHSDTNYSINRDIFERVLASPDNLSGLARTIPHEENGRVVGSRLYGIRRNALLGRLGVQNGDMLRTINGFEVSSFDQNTDAALTALTTIRGSNQLTVSVIRRGQPVTLEYTVK